LIDRSFWVCLDDEARDPNDRSEAMPVFLKLARDHRGRLVCQALIIGDITPWSKRYREINAARLRDIRIPELISLAVWTSTIPDEFGAEISEILSSVPALSLSPRGPRGYPDDHFRAVAELYRKALIEAPRAPTKWIAEQFVVSMPTARRWVQRARDKGYLGASTPGRAGEETGGSGRRNNPGSGRRRSK
jgi:hypothetical protein